MPEDEPYWDTLKIQDKILHVPYESYEPVVKFLSDAAKDPDVLTIKMTLYRTGRDSPIISALEQAAQNGKQVIVLVELKARFDEERNIAWANELEQAGVTVIYGLVNLKVHAKILMVIRRESDTIRRYVHLSTGNYNARTAQIYSDAAIFTVNEEIANDITLFFNLISGYSALQTMKKIAIAPVNLKSRLISLIEREAETSVSENPGLIVAKLNAIGDEDVIDSLCEASKKGVKILLNVRGICRLNPAVSEHKNIRVVSVVGRYLEHSRIIYFKNGGNEELFISSADWMNRNLERRVELLIPVTDSACFLELKDNLLRFFKDDTHAHELNGDGSWTSVKGGTFSVQASLHEKYASRQRPEIEPASEFEVRRKG